MTLDGDAIFTYGSDRESTAGSWQGTSTYRAVGSKFNRFIATRVPNGRNARTQRHAIRNYCIQVGKNNQTKPNFICLASVKARH